MNVFPLIIQAKMPFDANKLYCSEILAILLQNNDSKSEPRVHLGYVCRCQDLSTPS